MPVKPFPFFSAALFSRKTCYIYLPPGYENLDHDYPVIYLLHGLFGSETDWSEKGSIARTADRLIAEKKLRETIIVMPNDGEYHQGTFYVDWYDGTGNFGQYITDDLIPAIDDNFRTLASREGRMAAGMSMGGYGAFVLALRNPDLFGGAASLSGALGSPSFLPEHEVLEIYRLSGPMRGAHYRAHDLGLLARRRAQEEARPDLYFNCGRDDFLYWANIWYKEQLDEAGYPYIFEEFEGDHGWEFWTKHIEEVLLFFEGVFRKRLGDGRTDQGIQDILEDQEENQEDREDQDNPDDQEDQEDQEDDAPGN